LTAYLSPVNAWRTVYDGMLVQQEGEHPMKRLAFAVLGALALALTLAVAAGASARGMTIMEFNVMAPVAGPFVGATNPIRGINGGGLAWQLASAEGELRADGKLELEVRGLVLVATGANPVPLFRATVSCLVSNATTPVNVSTNPVPATTGPAAQGGGNAHIEARLALPHPCLAPIVFVNNGTVPAPGQWFAITGAP
jgi:hypothetical protein